MIKRFNLSDNWSLLKVPDHLRQVNEKAYEPRLISIGPYHHGKLHLAKMEVYKKQCLKKLCDVIGTESVARCMQDMNMEAARKFYPQQDMNLDLESAMPALIEMMLLDGFFIVALLCGRLPRIDPILNLDWILIALLYDLLLLENQLPFFVLVKLHGIFKRNPSDGEDFAPIAFRVLCELLPGPKKWTDNLPTIKDTDNIKHLLSLVHDNWSPSPQGIKCHREYSGTTEEKERAGEEARGEGRQDKWKFTLCSVADEESGVTRGEHTYFKRNFMCCAIEKQNVRKGRMGWNSMRCATELDEAGIQFVNSTEDSNAESLFDISFTNGIMKIPTFGIHDYAERLFRNLIAYEQYDQKGPTYVTDYVTLMDCLINSSKDVQLLRFSEIIENSLGDDESAAQMINKLCEHVIVSPPENFYYREIFDNVGKHCKRRWNILRAKLMRDYFNSPWAIISVLAATLVILLTIAQTVFSALSL